MPERAGSLFRVVIGLLALSLPLTMFGSAVVRGAGPVQAASQGSAFQGMEAEAGAGPALDLNTASAAELKALPGMGDAYVRRVIEGRPYTAKNQLVTRGVLPREAYEQIRDRIVAHRPPKQ